MDAARVRYVFLDRDGVINRKLREGPYVTEWSQFTWLPGALEALSALHRAGLTVLVVTNQRGIALGLYTKAQLENIHARMQADLAQRGGRIDAIYYCPHDRGQCHCRKPDVGMFEEAFQQFSSANPENSVMIGDSLSDIEAGKRLGMQTIFIQGKTDREREADATKAAGLADAVAGSLREAVELHLLPDSELGN